jgi:DNA polymerase-1
VLSNHGITLRGVRFDSMPESYLWNSTATRHDMDPAAGTSTSASRRSTPKTSPAKARRQIPFSQVQVDKAAERSSRDSDVTLRLHEVSWPEISSRARAEDAGRNLRAAAGAGDRSGWKNTGVLIDRQMLRTQSNNLAKQLLEVLAEAHREAGAPFNRRFAETARQHPVREDAAAGQCARRRPGQPSTAEVRARGTRRSVRTAAADPRAPQSLEAQID